MTGCMLPIQPHDELLQSPKPGNATETSNPLPLESFSPDIFTPSSLPPTKPTTESTETLRVTPVAVLHSIYSLEARFTPADRRLDVKEQVIYTNSTGQTLKEILLVVDSNQEPGIFNLQKVVDAKGKTLILTRLEGIRLWVTLPTDLLIDQKVELNIQYQINLPYRSGVLTYNPLQANFGDWYPYIPPYQEETGWLVHDPGLVGEHLAYDLADFSVKLLVSDTQAEWVVAASAPLDSPGRNQFNGRVEAARNFTWSGSPAYRVAEGNANGVELRVYSFAGDERAGQAALKVMQQALVLFAERFGEYPHLSLSLVETSFPDGMEYDGFFFLNQEYFTTYYGNAQAYLVALTAHETAHQWWYGLVGNDPAQEPWLDESLSTYSELIYYEKYAADTVIWWWGTRVAFYTPEGWVNGTIFNYAGYRSYVNAVYLRGALFLQALREKMGEQAFWQFWQEYANRYREQRVSAADFFNLLNEYYSVDRNWLEGYFQPD
jgi:hypothetical protein